MTKFGEWNHNLIAARFLYRRTLIVLEGKAEVAPGVPATPRLDVGSDDIR